MDYPRRALGKAKGVPFADRAFVLVANGLSAPSANIAWPAGWRPISCVIAGAAGLCPTGTSTSQPGPLQAGPRPWYRTLDQPVAAKAKIEVALYHRLRDLFSFKPDLVLYDITSTYFEAPGRPTSPSTATAATTSRTTSR